MSRCAARVRGCDSLRLGHLNALANVLSIMAFVRDAQRGALCFRDRWAERRRPFSLFRSDAAEAAPPDAESAHHRTFGLHPSPKIDRHCCAGRQTSLVLAYDPVSSSARSAHVRQHTSAPTGPLEASGVSMWAGVWGGDKFLRGMVKRRHPRASAVRRFEARDAAENVPKARHPNGLPAAPSLTLDPRRSMKLRRG